MGVVKKYKKHKDVPGFDSAVSVVLLTTDAFLALIVFIALLGTFAGSLISGAGGAMSWFLFALLLVPYILSSLLSASLPDTKWLVVAVIIDIITILVLIFAMPLGNSDVAVMFSFFPCLFIFAGFVAEVILLSKRLR